MKLSLHFWLLRPRLIANAWQFLLLLLVVPTAALERIFSEISSIKRDFIEGKAGLRSNEMNLCDIHEGEGETEDM